MKRILTLLLIVASIASGCNNAQKLLQNGRYDAALNKATKKLHRKPGNEKFLEIAEQAFNNAVRLDNDRVKFLLQEDVDANWAEIYELYSQMDRRQELIENLVIIPNYIDLVNYDQAIIEAKKNTANFHHAQALQLLRNGDKMSARGALDHLNQLKKLYPHYDGVDSLLSVTRNAGMTYVLVQVQNGTGVPLPPDAEREMQAFTVADINTFWVNYQTIPVPDLAYDYTVQMQVLTVHVSPEQITETRTRRDAQIQDGEVPKRDRAGKVLTDSLGNQIMVPRFKRVVCTLIESHQFKSAALSGDVLLLDNLTGEVLYSKPFTAETVFEHVYGSANGNLLALKPADRELIKIGPVAFPSNPEMVIRAASTFRSMAPDMICAAHDCVH